MISFTSAQLDLWLTSLLFPLARVLGLVAAAPVFGNAALPRRVRLILGLFVALALVPVLPPMPPVPAGSWLALAIVGQQMLIGILLGFTLRLAFAAIDIAGELVGLQMGLSFATFYDPQNAGQSPVLSEFLGLIATLLFLAMNGHLLALSALAESFRLAPVTVAPSFGQGLGALLVWSGAMFSVGVLLALPAVTALLIANIAMGVLSRVAPQLNLFAVGFPVTMVAGFSVLMLSMPYFGAGLERLFDQAFAALHMVMQATAG